jgi:hypothetical protein
MRKSLAVFMTVVASLMIFYAVSYADNIKVNDIFYYQDGVGSTNGGEFNVDVNPIAGKFVATDFVTFCVQTSEYLDFTSAFRVANISLVSVVAGGSALAHETAWLYAQYRAGSLDDWGTIYAYNDETSANALQRAIWQFQGQSGGAENYLYDLAKLHAISTDPGYSNYYGVRIANMVYASTGKAAQDVLITPEPLTLLLLGLGLFGLGITRKIKK